MAVESFKYFVEVMQKLRVECPWDKEQTHDSMKAATLEEAYEVIDAIDSKDASELKGELGDLLMHIVFHSLIAEESNEFTLAEVIDSINKKMKRRHPHIFSDVVVHNNKDITRNWETIKLQEGRNSVVDGIPNAMPQLQKSFRIQEKVSKVGFDWENINPVWEKVKEEINEFEEVKDSNNQDLIEDEFGDLLFSLINFARFKNINPENALRKTNAKFIKRFKFIEKALKEQGKLITESSIEEMNKYWEESKIIT